MLFAMSWARVLLQFFKNESGKLQVTDVHISTSVTSLFRRVHCYIHQIWLLRRQSLSGCKQHAVIFPSESTDHTWSLTSSTWTRHPVGLQKSILVSITFYNRSHFRRGFTVCKTLKVLEFPKLALKSPEFVNVSLSSSCQYLYAQRCVKMRKYHVKTHKYRQCKCRVA